MRLTRLRREDHNASTQTLAMANWSEFIDGGKESESEAYLQKEEVVT